MFPGPESEHLLVDDTIQMEMTLIGKPLVVENTLFVSSSSRKIQPLLYVMVSTLMHHSNFVRKQADPSAQFAELNVMKFPVLLALFLSVYSDFVGLPF